MDKSTFCGAQKACFSFTAAGFFHAVAVAVTVSVIVAVTVAVAVAVAVAGHLVMIPVAVWVLAWKVLVIGSFLFLPAGAGVVDIAVAAADGLLVMVL